MDQANRDIKLYLARLDWERMSAAQEHRARNLTSFAINLEQAADVVAKHLLKLAENKVERRLNFSSQGWQELTNLHAQVLTNLQLALNVLVSEDLESARHLVVQKDVIGALERDSVSQHLTRLRSGVTSSIETSDLHLEAIHALKRINSLLSGIAYSILSESGALLDSRLAPPQSAKAAFEVEIEVSPQG